MKPQIHSNKPPSGKPWPFYLLFTWYVLYFFVICITFHHSPLWQNITEVALCGYGFWVAFYSLKQHNARKIREVEQKLDAMFSPKPATIPGVGSAPPSYTYILKSANCTCTGLIPGAHYQHCPCLYGLPLLHHPLIKP
jgi:hypothetical protein